MVHVENNEISLKIADFGFARVIEEEQMMQSEVGTPAYKVKKKWRENFLTYI